MKQKNSYQTFVGEKKRETFRRFRMTTVALEYQSYLTRLTMYNNATAPVTTTKVPLTKDPKVAATPVPAKPAATTDFSKVPRASRNKRDAPRARYRGPLPRRLRRRIPPTRR